MGLNIPILKVLISGLQALFRLYSGTGQIQKFFCRTIPVFLEILSISWRREDLIIGSSEKFFLKSVSIEYQ
jgi:hypothetical protein